MIEEPLAVTAPRRRHNAMQPGDVLGECAEVGIGVRIDQLGLRIDASDDVRLVSGPPQVVEEVGGRGP